MQGWTFLRGEDDERALRLAHAAALVGVAVVAAFAWAFATGPVSTFTLFLAVVALSAWNGGAAPGIVAMLASILAIDVALRTRAATVVGPWSAFAASGVVMTWLLDRDRDRLRTITAELNATRRELLDVSTREHDAQRLNIAHDRLASLIADAATLVLSTQGVVTAWTTGARRMYGHTAGEMLGVDARTLFGSADASALPRLLADAAASGRARWSGVHRRRDGTLFDIDLEIRPVDGTGTFTAVVRDLTRDRQWDAFCASAARSESALRDEVELMRRQLAALESVTDPMVDTSCREDIEQLLERLRVAIDADGVGFVQPSGVPNRVILARGVQPIACAPRGQSEIRRVANRVLVVQNDSARVEQSSALAWPDTVSCLVAVPIAAAGQARGGVLEVVNERPRRSTDADMALIRVVANRVAVFGHAYGEADAVA